MDTEHESKVLIEIKNVSLFRLMDNMRQLLSKGTLRICQLPEQNIYYINQDDFFFTVQKQIPFIGIPFNTHKTYIFPHIEKGYNAICVEWEDSTIVQLDIILSNIGTFIPKENMNYSDEDLRNSINIHCVNIFDTPLIDDDQTTHYIKKGGGFLKEGFLWMGKMTATGINKAGEFINSKISSSNKVEVSQDTKEKFNKIKETTKSTFKVSGAILSSVLTPMVSATSKLVEDLNKKIDEGDNSTLKKVKKIGGATLDATGTAFSGIATGIKEIGKTLGDNTRTIVEKKYGDDITNTFVGPNEDKSQEEKEKSTDQSSQNLLSQQQDQFKQEQ